MTLRLLWRIVLRGSGAKVLQNQYCRDVAVPPWGEGERTGSPALARPLDRHDGSSPCSASPAPDPLLEIEHLGLRAEPKPQQKLRRQQRDVIAGGAIDLDEVALPETLDPCGVEGKIGSPMFLVCL
jgi:hypothetical protein